MMSPTRIPRSIALAVAVLALGSTAAPAQQQQPAKDASRAIQKEAFTEERFTALQEQGALILLDVFADWCSTCALQQKVLADYLVKHPDVPLRTLTINFDTQKEYVRKFRAPRQSTLILYRGTERIWFGVAETRPAVIFAALNKAAAATP